MRPRFSSGAKTARARPDDDAHAARADVLPLVVPLAGGEMAVQHRDAHLLADETGERKCSTVCGVSAISGTSTSAVLPAASTSAMACR